jgi:ABC-type multidrug transport system fused ATPase/permease subunit
VNDNSLKLLVKLFGKITFKQKKQLIVLTILMLACSMAEMISVGSIIPFLTILISPEGMGSSVLLVKINKFFQNDRGLVLFALCLIFSFAGVIAGGLRILLQWFLSKISYQIGSDICVEIYRRTLYQNYEVHLSRNSSSIIDTIATQGNVATNFIYSFLNFIGSCLLLLGVLMLLLFINMKVAIISFLGFAFIYISIIYFTKGRQIKNSKTISNQSKKVIQLLQEGLGGIRDILIDGTQNHYCKDFSKADIELKKAQGNSVFMITSPRFAMEALGMVMIAALAYILSHKTGDLNSAIPILGALALGAQRMIPILQQGYSSWAYMQSSNAVIFDVTNLLYQKIPDVIKNESTKKLKFNQQIKLKDISFRYLDNEKWILQNVNLEIKKGDRIGVVGFTGSGKSTLIDIILGLLKPDKGMIIIDETELTEHNIQNWQKNIAHVPQSIYLRDGNVYNNIAFGVQDSEIDRELVREVARKAQIANDIHSWQNRYETIVGERGARLSGGQRQRIGVARALYKQAEVIIFDEATSALDNITENQVMESFENLDKEITLIIIAHRVSTLRSCNKIFEINNGEVKNCGKYQDLVGESIFRA